MKTRWTTQAAAPLCTLLLSLLLVACDAFVTGEQVVNFDLKPQADGGYAPVTVTLGPEMNPVALNFRAELPGSGYVRLERGQTILLMDCGAPPALEFAGDPALEGLGTL